MQGFPNIKLIKEDECSKEEHARELEQGFSHADHEQPADAHRHQKHIPLDDTRAPGPDSRLARGVCAREPPLLDLARGQGRVSQA